MDKIGGNMKHELLGAKGEKHILLGNEAIVRGALEAGINVVTCYPGTPSSEVPDTFRSIGMENGNFYLEYSVNEKVAVEVGVGASLGGSLTMTTMKHVGVNVAADPLFTAAYVGLPGGYLLLSADDPFCHSSQNEQDNRTYARFMGFPCLEPATAQEAKEMTKEALLLSRKVEQPFMLRTTTRVNHLRGIVEFDALPESPAEKVEFPRNPMRFVPVPAVSRQRHVVLVENLAKVQEMAESSKWNKISGNESAKIGVIASGISRAYLADAILENNLQDSFKVFDLGFSYPLPEKKLQAFIESCDTVLIVEEGEPLVEKDLKALANTKGITTKILGKGKYLTIFGEYSVKTISDTLLELVGKSIEATEIAAQEPLPIRPPSLCPGCSHRSVFYSIRKVFGDDAYYSSDIGCYTLGMVPPLRMADFLFCMGSSVSAGGGFALNDKPVIGLIGDSTFFHSGVSGLVNAVFNKHNLIFVILDNGTTAMTGHQPNPGVRADVLGDYCAHIDIESVVRGCGVTEIAKVKAYNVKATMKAFEEMKDKTGVRVIIAEEPCVLFAKRTLKKEGKVIAEIVEQNQELETCLNELACPAFKRDNGNIAVDETLCTGCMVCKQIAPSIKTKSKK